MLQEKNETVLILANKGFNEVWRPFTFKAVERERDRRQRAAAAILKLPLFKHCLLVSARGAWREINKMAALSARCVRSVARASIQISVSYLDKQAETDAHNFLT